MESRKIIKFGNTSYVISIPKSWVEENKLKKGDNIYLAENINHELVIFPNFKEPQLEVKKIFIKTDNKNVEELKREIYSNYLAGYDIITLEGKEIKSDIKKLRSIIHNLMSFSIIEQEPTRVVAKDFFNIKEVSIESFIRRMDILTRGLLGDSKQILKDKKLYNNIIETDQEINKLDRLISRSIRKAVLDLNLINYLKLTHSYLFSTSHLSDKIEKIADGAKRLSGFLIKLKKSNDLKFFLEIYSDIEKDFEKVMKAYYTKDKNLASEIVSRRNKMLDECDVLYKNHIDPHYGGRIIETLKGMIGNTGDIARIVYNE